MQHCLTGSRSEADLLIQMLPCAALIIVHEDRIENMRRQLAVNSNTSTQDMESIQTVELLGEGTFGKVSQQDGVHQELSSCLLYSASCVRHMYGPLNLQGVCVWPIRVQQTRAILQHGNNNV